ncbi:MAG: diguanylate cyclase (GGDEF)-like protein [Glaciecola sp.]|jgi:diguanylate cyclase (GGDEF)-like protein
MTNPESKPANNSLWLAVLVAGFTLVMLFMVTSLGQNIEKHSLKQKIYHHEDTTKKLSIASIDQVDQDAWAENDSQNFGLTPFPQWLKVDFSTVEKNQILEIDYAMLDSIQLWLRKKGEDNKYQILEQYELGDSLAFSQRPIIHDKFLIPLPNELMGVQLLLRVQSNGPVKAPLKLWFKKDYIVHTASHRMFMGLFFGYMLAMVIINIFLYISARNLTFITYAGYVISFALLIASIHGLGYRFIWPESAWLQERTPAIFAFMTMSFILVFSSHILELKKHNPKYQITFNIFSIVFIVACIASFIVPYVIMIKLLLVLLLLSIPAIFVVSVSLALKGSAIAKFFCAAWIVLLISGLSASADNFHWISLPIDSSYLLMVGAMTETLLLALAVATSYSVQRNEAKQSHIESAQNEQKAIQAQKELLAVQKQAQVDLEEQVSVRTQEFEEALAGLSKVNEELQSMSETDTLTGLTNRRFFETNIVTEAARSRREKQPLAIALLDIDHFKKVNDEYGHQCGDDCLIEFSKTLKEIIQRPGDLLSRYGGEEFVLLLPNTTIEGATNLLERFRLEVEKLVVETHGHKIQFTVSAGVTSRVVGSDEEAEKMLSYADKLLYQAKKSGRNQVKSGSF